MTRPLLLALAACWLTCAAALAEAGPPVEPPDGAPPPPPTEPAGEAPDLEARRATLGSYQVEQVDEEKLVRITLRLSYPRARVEAGFPDSPATFRVVLANTQPAARLPREIPVAEGAVADLVLRTPEGSSDLEVLVRLNTPVACTAFAVASEQKVVIECRNPEPQPQPAPAPGDGVDRKLDLEFVDTDIRVIINTIVAESGANIVLRPAVSGSYSMALRQVTLTQALDTLWEAWDLCWKRLSGGVYLVGPETELGDDLVEEELPVPAGWTPADLAATLAHTFPGVAPSRELVAESGALVVAGPLKLVGPARRWAVALAARPEGAGPPPPAPLAETADYYPRFADTAALLRELGDRLPDVEARHDSEVGRITIRGPRDRVVRAVAILREIDAAPDPVVDKALVIDLEPQPLTDLARVAGVTIQIVGRSEEGSLAYVRGPESKVKAIEELAARLAEVQPRQPGPEPPDGPVFGQAPMEPAEVTAPPVHLVWRVRYGRAGELADLVREAVPELTLVADQAQRRPGAVTAGGVRDQPVGMGPTPPSAPDDPSPQLVLIGPGDAVERARALLEAVDTPPGEVELTAVLAELTAEAAKALGLVTSAGEAPTFDPLTGGDLPAVLRVFAGTPGVSILAGPTVRVVDGGQAELAVGGPAGDRPEVHLALWPSLPGDGSILCRVRPEVRAGGGKPGAARTRVLESTVRLGDGAVISLGSLLEGGDGGRLVVLLSGRLIGATAR